MGINSKYFSAPENGQVKDRKTKSRRAERGNALVYVLIVIALFAALSFILSRSSDTAETETLPDEKVEIYASMLQQTAMQVKQGVDMMLYSGSVMYDSTGQRDLVFTTPDDEPAYSTAPHEHKVFHPQGGGVGLPAIPVQAREQVSTNPPPGWYLGQFNNVGWTENSGIDGDELILTAHQINQLVCAKINERLTGDPTIPELTDDANKLLIDGADSTVGDGNNVDFTAAHCVPDLCDGRPSLCVKDDGVNSWSFYSIIEHQ